MLDDKGEVIVDAKGNPVLFRQCVIWPINGGEKKFAIERCMGDANKVADELARQMIRVVDGQEVDWQTPEAGGIEQFWMQLGEKCRGLLVITFNQLHVLAPKDQIDFLSNCIVIRST